MASLRAPYGAKNYYSRGGHGVLKPSTTCPRWVGVGLGGDNVPVPYVPVTWPRTTRYRRRRTRRATTVTLKPFYTGMVTAATTSPKVAISVLLVGAISTLI